MHTLNDQAAAQEGTPIRAGHAVRVELVNSFGVVVESGIYTGEIDADELKHWVADYIVCMAAEGMAGSVRWTGDVVCASAPR